MKKYTKKQWDKKAGQVAKRYVAIHPCPACGGPRVLWDSCSCGHLTLLFQIPSLNRIMDLYEDDIPF